MGIISSFLYSRYFETFIQNKKRSLEKRKLSNKQLIQIQQQSIFYNHKKKLFIVEKMPMN